MNLVSPEFQAAYDTEVAEDALSKELAKIKSWSATAA